MTEIFERISNWQAGNRSRLIVIEHDDRFGASCWEVHLRHEHGETHSVEIQFMGFSKEKGGAEEYIKQAKLLGTVFVQRDDNSDEWPGCEATINTALDAFAQGIWKVRE